MFSFFSKDKAELGAVFNIGSSSVGAGLVKFRPDQVPEIVYTTREPIPYQEIVSPERFLTDMVKTLGTVHARLHKEGLAHLKFTQYGSHKMRHVLYAFSSPWAASQTKIASIENPEPVTITREMVQNVIAKAEKSFESEVVDPTHNSELKDKLSVIENRIIQIRLNGYEATEPYGKKAKRVDVSFFISLVPKMVIDRVSDASLGALHSHDTHFTSAQLASYSALREIFSGRQGFIVLDIGGEVSDVSVIKNGLILETASFPLGRNFLTRRVSRALSVTNDGALSLLRLYYGGDTDTQVAEALRPVLDNAAHEWIGALHTTLTQISGTLSLPQDLHITLGGDLVPFFMRAVREEKISQFDVVDVPFRVTLVNHELLKKHVSFSSSAVKDPTIALATIFASHILRL
jgi:hypothetical protein